jgi:glycosyltransferase involved in cell wall biosynthesis
MYKYGTFVATTRMDAQGVIMCEAMAAGMLVVTSNNTAIPEFVSHMETGLCHYDLSENASELKNLEQTEEKFKQITNNARQFMLSINIKQITKKELEILKG